MKYQPFVFWAIALIIGILLQYYFEFNTNIFWVIGGVSVLILLIFRTLNVAKKFFPWVGIILVIVLGAHRFQQKNNLTQINVEILEKPQLFHLEIDKQFKPSKKYQKYIATIVDAEDNFQIKNEKILLYQTKNSEKLHVRDKFWTYGKIHQIPSPKNPHQFDYQKYMQRKGVRLQLFSDTLVSNIHPLIFSPMHELSAFKQNIKNQLDTKGFSPVSKVFISSLALGDRSDVNQDFMEILTSAGVMHLFAISGLHVGIVYFLIMILLYPVLFLKYGKIIRILLALCMIWAFAWFVGFTPSVTRAAFMISIYYLTLILQRRANIFHTLFFTAFVLLIFNPNNLFDIGFQLSYSAVFFIVWLYDPVRKFFPKYRKPRKNYFFDLLTVTSVAQLGVLPISIFYFNKFSGLFLLGNMVLLPFASAMIVISFATVLLLTFGIMPNFLVSVVNFLFDFVFKYLDLLTSFDSLIFRNVSWNLLQVALILLILLGLRQILGKFKFKYIFPLLIIFFLFQLTRIYDEFTFQNKNEFIVFHEYKGNVLGIRNGNNLDVFWNVQDSVKTANYTLQPYILNKKIDSISFFEWNDSHIGNLYIKENNWLKIKDKLYFISNNSTIDFPEVENIILAQSNWKLKDTIAAKTKMVIADGSNYPSIIHRLKENLNVVYSTQESGAFLETIQ